MTPATPRRREGEMKDKRITEADVAVNCCLKTTSVIVEFEAI